MLNDGIVHVIASDAHDTHRRVPRLAEGCAAAAKYVGDAEAQRMVLDRPQAVLANANPDTVVPALAYQDHRPMLKDTVRKGGWLRALWG